MHPATIWPVNASAQQFAHPAQIRAVKRRANEAGITRAQQVVLGALCDRIDGGGQCHPSHETLAEEARVSRRTSIRAVQFLEKAGILHRHVPPPKVRAFGGPKACTRYVVILPAYEARAMADVVGPEGSPAPGAGAIAGETPPRIPAPGAGDTAEGVTEKARDIPVPKQVTLVSPKDTREEIKNTPAQARTRDLFKKHVPAGPEHVSAILAPPQIAALGGTRRERSFWNRENHARARGQRLGERIESVRVPQLPPTLAPPRAVSAPPPAWTETERAAAVAAMKEIRESGFRLKWDETFQRQINKIDRGS